MEATPDEDNGAGGDSLVRGGDDVDNGDDDDGGYGW